MGCQLVLCPQRAFVSHIRAQDSGWLGDRSTVGPPVSSAGLGGAQKSNRFRTPAPFRDLRLTGSICPVHSLQNFLVRVRIAKKWKNRKPISAIYDLKGTAGCRLTVCTRPGNSQTREALRAVSKVTKPCISYPRSQPRTPCARTCSLSPGPTSHTYLRWILTSKSQPPGAALAPGPSHCTRAFWARLPARSEQPHARLDCPRQSSPF